MINKYIILVIFANSIYSCVYKQREIISAKIRINDSTFRFEDRRIDEFTWLYDNFYQDRNGKFYIKSSKFVKLSSNNNPIYSPVYIEIPFLDSNSFMRMGNYLKDKKHVICIFENSDGGNYVSLKNVDPVTFVAFKNVFGGKDSGVVFFQNKILSDLDAKHVKVYSNQASCINCDGYFKDSNVIYLGGRKILDTGLVIPNEYKYVE
jgi:hypothetical protein